MRKLAKHPGTVLVLLIPFVALTRANAGDLPSLTLHIQPASYAGCAAFDADTASCSSLIHDGDSSNAQHAFVLSSGVDSLMAVQFGVAYDSTVTILGWTSCTDGLVVPEDGWPDAGTAIACAWGAPQVSASADGLVTVGYFTLASGSSGAIHLTGDMRDEGLARYATASIPTFPYPAGSLGAGDSDGEKLGYCSCSASVEVSEVAGDLEGLPTWIGGGQSEEPLWVRILGPADEWPRTYAGRTDPETGKAITYSHADPSGTLPSSENQLHLTEVGGGTQSSVGFYDRPYYPDRMSENQEGLLAIEDGSSDVLATGTRKSTSGTIDGLLARVDPGSTPPSWQKTFNVGTILSLGSLDTHSRSLVRGGGAPGYVATTGDYLNARVEYPFLSFFVPSNGALDDLVAFSNDDRVAYSEVVAMAPSPYQAGGMYLLARKTNSASAALFTTVKGASTITDDPVSITLSGANLVGLAPTLILNSAADLVFSASFHRTDEFGVESGILRITRRDLLNEESTSLQVYTYEPPQIIPLDIEVDDDDAIYVSGWFGDQPGVLKVVGDFAADTVADIEWLHLLDYGQSSAVADPPASLGLLSIEVSGSLVYASGTFHLGPSHYGGYTVCIDAADGHGRYYHELEPDEYGSYYSTFVRSISVDRVNGTDYVYVHGSLQRAGSTGFADPVVIRYPDGRDIVSVGEAVAAPPARGLMVRGGDRVHVRLPELASSPTRVEVFDVAGRRVAIDEVSPGERAASIEAPTGVAFVRVEGYESDARMVQVLP